MLEKDIKYLNDIMNNRNNNYFHWLYPFTNENIKAYLNNINLNNKNILTVTSSGDHLLNACLLGTKNIDAFDTNPLSKYYTELKIAAIKTLSLEEFILFFYNKKLFNNKYYFNKNIYDKFKNNLKNYYKIFWDYFFKNYNNKDINKSNLFIKDYLNIKKLIEVNNYMNEFDYYILREKLKNININYYDINFQDIKNIDKKYDVLILSNIAAYYENEVYKDNLLDLKKTIDKITHESSEVIACYLYSDMIDSKINKGIYNIELVNKYFDNYKYISFPSAEYINKINICDTKKEDVVLIKKL